MLSVHWMTTVSGFISHSYLGHLRMSVPMPDPRLLQWLDILWGFSQKLKCCRMNTRILLFWKFPCIRGQNLRPTGQQRSLATLRTGETSQTCGASSTFLLPHVILPPFLGCYFISWRQSMRLDVFFRQSSQMEGCIYLFLYFTFP